MVVVPEAEEGERDGGRRVDGMPSAAQRMTGECRYEGPHGY